MPERRLSRAGEVIPIRGRSSLDSALERRHPELRERWVACLSGFCSDGFLQMMNLYLERQVSRQCWKIYNNGANCPWATSGAQQCRVRKAGDLSDLS
jgi:hypothetical protein